MVIFFLKKKAFPNDTKFISDKLKYNLVFYHDTHSYARC
jgi:hypothetical protein